MQIDGHPAIESDRVRDRIGQFAAEVEALSALTYANLTRWLRGRERMHDAAMGKLMFSEINLEMARFAVELGGEAGVLVEGDGDVLDHGRWQDEWLYARAYTIAGGSSEIMRNLIAERGSDYRASNSALALGGDQCGAVLGNCSVEGFVHLDPAQEQVQVVLPGESDAAVHLERGACDRAGRGFRIGDGRRRGARPRLVGRTVQRQRGRPECSPTGLHAESHVRTVMFDGLERTDRGAELFALHRIGHRHLQQACRAAQSVERPVYRKRIPHVLRCSGRHGHPVECDRIELKSRPRTG